MKHLGFLIVTALVLSAVGSAPGQSETSSPGNADYVDDYSEEFGVDLAEAERRVKARQAADG